MLTKTTQTSLITLFCFIAGFYLLSSDAIAGEKRASAPEEAIGVEQGIFIVGMAPVSMDWKEGEAFCTEQGFQLPSGGDLKSVAAGSGDGKYQEYAWPKGIFWTREPEAGGHKVVSMGNGAEVWFPDGSRQWVVCVENPETADENPE